MSSIRRPERERDATEVWVPRETGHGSEAVSVSAVFISVCAAFTLVCIFCLLFVGGLMSG